jgi:hypothetical protein
MKKIFLASFLLFLAAITFGQKKISEQNHAWTTYQGNHKLSKKWGLHTEYQWRRADFYQHWQQSLMRIGLDYHLNPNAFVSAGYGSIITFQYGEIPVSHQFNEHRIWEQFTQKSTIGRVDIQHRYRLEQRILDNYIKSGNEYVKDGTVFRNRVRYRAMAFIPLNHSSMSDNTLFLNVNDEVFLGFGEGIGTNILDQNRLQVALGWKFNSKCMVQAGYMNQYVVKNAKVSLTNTVLDQAENNNTLTIGLTYNFDFSKKEATK